MALIKCPECGNDVSDTLDSCVHCGYKLNIFGDVENAIEQAISQQPLTQSQVYDTIPNSTSIGEHFRKWITGIIASLFAIGSGYFLIIMFPTIIQSLSRGYQVQSTVTGIRDGVVYVEVASVGDYYFAWGILVFLLAILVITTIIAINSFVGYRVVLCPYCNRYSNMKRNAQRLKCKYCKRISVRKGDYLEAI